MITQHAMQGGFHTPGAFALHPTLMFFSLRTDPDPPQPPAQTPPAPVEEPPDKPESEPGSLVHEPDPREPKRWASPDFPVVSSRILPGAKN
jgi:hypothetical protein